MGKDESNRCCSGSDSAGSGRQVVVAEKGKAVEEDKTLSESPAMVKNARKKQGEEKVAARKGNKSPLCESAAARRQTKSKLAGMLEIEV